MALLPVDSTQLDAVFQGLLAARPKDLAAIQATLAGDTIRRCGRCTFRKVADARLTAIDVATPFLELLVLRPSSARFVPRSLIEAGWACVLEEQQARFELLQRRLLLRVERAPVERFRIFFKAPE